MVHDPVAARRALDERLDRAFEGATPAPITAAIDALIAAVRAEQKPLSIYPDANRHYSFTDDPDRR
jgi:hypothetical protein